MTPQEALDAIGRLCDEREHGPGPGWVAVDEVRAVLAEPGPAVPAHDDLLDALRTTLESGLREHLKAGNEPHHVNFERRYADRVSPAILALVRPVAGVILSPDEVALARSWYTRLPIGVSPDDVALAARLEASS